MVKDIEVFEKVQQRVTKWVKGLKNIMLHRQTENLKPYNFGEEKKKRGLE